MAKLSAEDRRRAQVLSSLMTYSDVMFYALNGKPMLRAPHQDAICRALERVVSGKTKRLVINMPPRSGKTELVAKMFVSWAMGLFPSSQFILTSYSKRLAASNTYSVRELMQHEMYRYLYPKVTLQHDSKAKEEFRTTEGGIVYGVGTEGTITGYGAGTMDDCFGGAIVVDDAAKPDDAQSDLMRQNVIDWFGSTLENRRNSPHTPIIVVSQRIHEQDLPGWLLDGGNGEDWELLKIPALKEDGSSFWPKQFPVADLERMQKKNPYIFAGQMQQEPAPKEGGDFKPGNIQLVDALPAGLNFARGWDLAGTTNKSSDYTATAKMAERDGIIYVAHAFKFKGAPDEVEGTIKQIADTDTDTRVSIPQDPGQAGVSQKQHMSRKLHGVDFEFSTESGDKRVRASGFAAQVNVGNVRFLKGEWNDELLTEMRMFPNGKHDDMIDACSRAYNLLFSGSGYTLDNVL